DSDRLVRVTESRQGKEPRVRGTMSNGPYHTWVAEHSTVESIGGWINVAQSMLAVDGGEPAQLQTVSVTPSIFTVLRARPLLGRLFVDGDVAAGAPRVKRVVVLSYGLWQERFGGSDGAVGRVVQLDGQPVTVVGVMPKAFAFPDGDTRAWTPWLPPPVHGQGGVLSMTIFSALA